MPKRFTSQGNKSGRTRFLKQELFEDGYINVEPLQRNPNLEKLVKIVRKLKKMGWPPVFIYVFDEAWEIYSRIWIQMENLLGGECVLEPSMFCYSLESQLKQVKRGTYVGGNFELPHRDHSSRESIDTQGRSMILSV